MEQLFPSPTGVLYLLIIDNIDYKLYIHQVSVPYWGSLSSNYRNFNRWNKMRMFPSPTGVLYLLIGCVGWHTRERQSVSVPYWGSLSSNLLAKTWERMNIVSVPYWGSLSSNSVLRQG